MLLHDVDAGNQLGNGVFDLYAGIHFNKEEFAIFIQKFESAGTAIADAFTGFNTGGTDFLALGLSDAGSRCFFNHFLVTALHRAIALAQINGVAMFVGQNLNFDVARFLQVTLHVHHWVAEGGTGFGFGHLYRFEQVFFFLDHAHTATATTTGGFDNHRETNLVGDFQDFFVVVRQRTFRTGYAGYAGGNHGMFGRNFVTHQADGFGAWADEDETGFFNLIGKTVVFSQETVAGVNGVGTGNLGGCNQRGNIQITLWRRCRADADGFIGQFDVQAVFIGFGMDGNGGNAHFTAGTQYTQCNLAAVGNQYFFQHGDSFGINARVLGLYAGRFQTGIAGNACLNRNYSMINSGSPYSTGWPFSTRMALITPERSASISFISFMASMMQRVSPSFTDWPTSAKAGEEGLGAR